MASPESEHDAEDLRDFFALVYHGDDWAFDSDTEIEAEVGTGGESARDSAGGADGAGQAVDGAEVDANAGEGTLGDGEIVSTVAATRQRYTRKRFTDQLDSLLYPSSKRSRIYTPASRPSSSSFLYTSTIPLPPLPPAHTYAPFSPLALLSRLRTYTAYTYSSSIPSPLTPRHVASYGWIAGGLYPADVLHCALCGAKWDLRGVSEIGEADIREEVARRMGEKGVRMKEHRRGCAWKVRHSEDGLYDQLRRMVHPPTVASLRPLKEALEGECEGLDRISWTSPLPNEALQALVASLGSSCLTTSASVTSDNTPNTESNTHSALPAALALLAWYPYHPNESSTHIDPPHMPTLDNVSDPVSDAVHAHATDATETSPRSSQTSIVQCRICERRVGLWAFMRSRSPSATATISHMTVSATVAELPRFHLVDEHQDWCPIKNDIRHDSALPGSESAGGGTAWWSDLPFLQPGKKQTGAISTGQRPGQEEKGKEERFRVSDRLVPKPWRRR